MPVKPYISQESATGYSEQDVEPIVTTEPLAVPDSTEKNDFNAIPEPPKGKSDVDFNDPNQISVTIEDQTTPIVILFGPPSCGKTMTMIRMTRWLNRKGYNVEPVHSFRPTGDTNYRNMCDSFNALVGDDKRANSTNNIQFMLLKVYSKGNPICQILEAPGELYFDPQKPNANYPAYLNTIQDNCNNRKVWCVFVEPDWMNLSDRDNYVNRIKRLKTKLRPYDKVVILHNKIDKTQYVIGPGHVNEAQSIKSVSDSYKGLFELFENPVPVVRLFKKYLCSYIPFQTGSYSSTTMGVETFQEGPDEYCHKLWEAILSSIRG